VKRSLKVKRNTFRSDADNVSEALYDKFIIDRYLMRDQQRQHEVEQGVLEFVNKVLYEVKKHN
jgi:hypothetical protein